MPKLLILPAALCLYGKTNAQVTMPADKKFYKHAYYKLLEGDTLQVSLIKWEDRKLLPPLDSIVKPYMLDYHAQLDSGKVEITARRVEYHADERKAFVFFAPVIVNEYDFKDGQVLTVKQGRDTVSITGILSNGRPYRVRFWVMYMKSMLEYGTGLDAMIMPRKKLASGVKKEDVTK